MSTALWVSLILGSLTLAGNLVNGYLQRKQMRQNELFRRDPLVGLIPPPHPLRTHLREYKLLYWNYGCSAVLLTVGFLAPLSRGSVLDISMGVVFFFYALPTYSERRNVETHAKIVSILENHAKLHALTAENVGLLLKNIDLKDKIDKRLDNTVKARFDQKLV